MNMHVHALTRAPARAVIHFDFIIWHYLQHASSPGCIIKVVTIKVHGAITTIRAAINIYQTAPIHDARFA